MGETRSVKQSITQRLGVLHRRVLSVRELWRDRRFEPPAGLTRRLGGAMGTRKARLSASWAYILATFSWLVCMTRQLPCRQTPTNVSPDRFGWMCYTDVTALYFRGETALGQLAQVSGGIPYITAPWEYPVLTGYFATAANFIASLLGADLSEEIDAAQRYINSDIYFSVTAVGLFICLLWLISSMQRLVGRSSPIVYAVALSPLLMTTGLINWDLLVVALTVAGLAAWSEKKPVWAGVWWGLGIAAKLYPLVIVGALFVLIVRKGALASRVVHSWVITAATTVGVWCLVNLPMMLTNFAGWSYFYTFNYSSRGADLGSFWLGLQLIGWGVADPALWSRVIMLIGYLALAALIFFAPRPPSAPQIAYLAVGIFVAGNLVYSPQYVLWLLPLVVLVRPRLLDLTVFTVGELFYFMCVWGYLRGNDLTASLGSTPWIYVASILIRLAATGWLMGRVVSDILKQNEELSLSARPEGVEPPTF